MFDAGCGSTAISAWKAPGKSLLKWTKVLSSSGANSCLFCKDKKDHFFGSSQQKMILIFVEKTEKSLWQIEVGGIYLHCYRDFV